MKKSEFFLSENFKFLEVKFSVYLNRRVFVMEMFQISMYSTCCLIISSLIGNVFCSIL